MLTLSSEFYSAAGIRSAVNTLADFGSFEWDGTASDGYFEVDIKAADDVDPVELEGEFANFALARTVEAARAAADS